MHIRGTRVSISVRGYAYPGYKGMFIRGTRVCLSGVRGYVYPGYEGMFSWAVQVMRLPSLIVKKKKHTFLRYLSLALLILYIPLFIIKRGLHYMF